MELLRTPQCPRSQLPGDRDAHPICRLLSWASQEARSSLCLLCRPFLSAFSLQVASWAHGAAKACASHVTLAAGDASGERLFSLFHHLGRSASLLLKAGDGCSEHHSSLHSMLQPGIHTDSGCFFNSIPTPPARSPFRTQCLHCCCFFFHVCMCGVCVLCMYVARVWELGHMCAYGGLGWMSESPSTILSPDLLRRALSVKARVLPCLVLLARRLWNPVFTFLD